MPLRDRSFASAARASWAHDATKTVALTEQPKTLDIYSRAVLGLLPWNKSNSRSVPQQTFTLTGLKVDTDNLAAYCRVTGLRFGDTLPITYPSPWPSRP